MERQYGRQSWPARAPRVGRSSVPSIMRCPFCGGASFAPSSTASDRNEVMCTNPDCQEWFRYAPDTTPPHNSQLVVLGEKGLHRVPWEGERDLPFAGKFGPTGADNVGPTGADHQ